MTMKLVTVATVALALGVLSQGQTGNAQPQGQTEKAAAKSEIPRTADGKPDFSGIFSAVAAPRPRRPPNAERPQGAGRAQGAGRGPGARKARRFLFSHGQRRSIRNWQPGREWTTQLRAACRQESSGSRPQLSFRFSSFRQGVRWLCCTNGTTFSALSRQMDGRR
jgi:hypothetical protein